MSDCKILIVDDMADVRLLLRKMLSIKGHNLIEAKNGVDAIEKIKENSDISLVLLDIMMPGMDGFETLEKIKEINLERNIKVCFLTAKSSHSDVKKAMRNGIDDYIVKPIDRDTVLSKVEKMLSTKGPEIKFSTIKTDLKIRVIGCPIPVDIKIRELSETELELSSNMEFEENSYIEIVSDTLSKLCHLENPLLCKVTHCKKEDSVFIIKAVLSGLSEKVAAALRSYTTRGKEIRDDE